MRDENLKCPKCGNKGMVKAGYDWIKGVKLQRYKCTHKPCSMTTVKPIKIRQKQQV